VDVVEVESAEAAFECLQDRGGRAAMVRLPGMMDGVVLAEQVHQRWPHVSLLICSGYARMHPDEILDHGQFIPKPGRLRPAHSRTDAHAAPVSRVAQAGIAPRRLTQTFSSPTAAVAGVPRPGSWPVRPPESAEQGIGSAASRQSRARPSSGSPLRTAPSPAPGS
jgi:hypothetical protein